MDKQKEYFEQAYNTGSDIWTLVSKKIDLDNFLTNLPKDAMLLDVGSGRGRVAFSLVDLGYKVIGLDYVSSIVEKNNDEAKTRGVLDKVRFVVGDATDIDFADGSFDAIFDIGTSHHFKKDEMEKYVKEISRVVKQGGYMFFVGLSRETPKYMTFLPQQSEDGEYDHHGVHNHFFTEEEIEKYFGETFEIVSMESMRLGEKDKLFYLIVSMKRK